MEEPTKIPDTPVAPKEHKYVEKSKAFGVYWFIGTAAFLAFSVLGLIGNSIGVETLNLKTIGSASDIILILSQLTWQNVLFIVFSAASVGAVSLFLITGSHSVGKLIHLHRDAVYTNEELRKEMVSQLRKLRILPCAMFGAFMGVIILPIIGGIYTLTGINALNAHELLNAYIGGHFIVIGIIVGGGAVTGAMMRHFQGEYQKTYERIQRNIPKKLDRVL
jgi:hypothetical protein